MPGMTCSVSCCKSNTSTARKTGEKIRFFNFPKNKEIRKEWMRRCNRKEPWTPTNKRICSKHFVEDEDFVDGIKAKLMNLQPKKLKEDAIPSLHLLPQETSQNKHQNKNCPKPGARTPRPKRKAQRMRKIFMPGTSSSCIQDEEDIRTERTEDLSCKTQESEVEVLKRRCFELSEENERLKGKLNESEKRIFILENELKNCKHKTDKQTIYLLKL